MKREDLLKSREYWIVQIQNNLFAILDAYMKKNDLSRTKLAEQLNVTKGYITQILSGDFDHKISKLVDLALASGKVPILNFVDLEQYIKNDELNVCYELMPMFKVQYTEFKEQQNTQKPIVVRQEIAPFIKEQNLLTSEYKEQYSPVVTSIYTVPASIS